MLLGIDIIQSMSSISLERKLGGTCLVIKNKVAPIGNVLDFLAKEQKKIKSVPSNHKVASKVLDRTVKHSKLKGLTDKYQAVFDQQLADGIIEEIDVRPNEYQNKIWIPHRPVLKLEEQVTTKIRPVFKCSLKTDKELPSLNEAGYPGVDLMNNILKLLFYFHSNKLVIISDIKQAFLMIKLKNEADQNKFCFFWKRGNEIVTYRFKTIVFGFT
ncbi:uncharacterized protein [Palaemon carinicauda]|uniref:uncharacterized protein n=1 Tax=Palaemon carinicauda TaxID=392227 RepID=UPI0035B5F578